MNLYDLKGLKEELKDVIYQYLSGEIPKHMTSVEVKDRADITSGHDGRTTGRIYLTVTIEEVDKLENTQP